MNPFYFILISSNPWTRLKINRIAIKDTESYQKLDKRAQLIFNAILSNDKTVSDIGKLLNDRLESTQSSILLSIDKQSVELRYQMDSSATSILQHSTREHETTRAHIQGIHQQSAHLNDQLQNLDTVLSVRGENDARTSTAIHDLHQELINHRAFLNRFARETGVVSHATPYALVNLDMFTEDADGNSGIKSIVQDLVKQSLPAAISASVRKEMIETCNSETVTKFQRFVATAENPSTKVPKSKVSSIPRKSNLPHLDKCFSHQGSSTSQHMAKRPQRKRKVIPKIVTKLQWQKRFSTPLGSAIMCSDLVIQEKLSFMRLEFSFMPAREFSTTPFQAICDWRMGSFSLATYSLRTWNLTPDTAIFEASGRYGDSTTLRELLMTGKGSPFDVNERGFSPLDVSIIYL